MTTSGHQQSHFINHWVSRIHAAVLPGGCEYLQFARSSEIPLPDFAVGISFFFSTSLVSIVSIVDDAEDSNECNIAQIVSVILLLNLRSVDQQSCCWGEISNFSHRDFNYIYDPDLHLHLPRRVFSSSSAIDPLCALRYNFIKTLRPAQDE